MEKVKKIIVAEIEDYKILLRNVPLVTMIFFVLSVVFMNIYANRELLNMEYLALDCGFLLSWMSFLCMDMLTKRFGAKAAIKLSIFALGCNLIMCGINFVICSIPGGNWSAYYNYMDEVANEALDTTFKGTWYVLMGSTIAMFVASIINAVINQAIGKMMQKNNFQAYAARSYISTAIGQFVDNLLFALIVSVTFFGWNMTQVITCSLTGAAMELLAEVVFSPIGYRASRKWEKVGTGSEYIKYVESKKSVA